MASFRSFEEIKAWQEAKELSILIYQFTKLESLKTDFGFKDQITRASISVMNNIAEGFERQNRKEFIRFLLIAKGSVGEVRSMLHLAKGLEYISENQFQQSCEKTLSISKKISSLTNYLQNQIGVSQVKEEQAEYYSL